MEGDKNSAPAAANIPSDGRIKGFNQLNMEGAHARLSKHI